MRIQSQRSTQSNRRRTDRQPSGPCLEAGQRTAAKAKSTPSPALPWPIKMVPLHHLKRAARNARSHPKKQIEQIVSSIRHFGYVDPVLADETLTIIGGHARADAAERAGIRE